MQRQIPQRTSSLHTSLHSEPVSRLAGPSDVPYLQHVFEMSSAHTQPPRISVCAVYLATIATIMHPCTPCTAAPPFRCWYLDPEYRRPLVLAELLGYNADLVCLQEVDEKMFTLCLQVCKGKRRSATSAGRLAARFAVRTRDTSTGGGTHGGHATCTSKLVGNGLS